jgi:hypothetical protein
VRPLLKSLLTLLYQREEMLASPFEKWGLRGILIPFCGIFS